MQDFIVRKIAKNPKWWCPEDKEELGLELWEWLKGSRTAAMTRRLDTEKYLLATLRLLLTLT